MDEEVNSKIEDGGPAFPRFEPDPWNRPRVTGGMSLRDWFAGQALVGIPLVPAVVKTPEKMAMAAYKVADAMLAARAKKGGAA